MCKIDPCHNSGVSRCHGASLETYKKGLRRHAKHVARWTAGGHYFGFVGDRSPRAQRNRDQARLLAELTKEHANAA